CVAESREQITDTSYPPKLEGQHSIQPCPSLDRESIHFATFAEKGRHIEILLLEIGDHCVSNRVNRDHISRSGLGCSLLHYHPRRCGFRLCFRLEKIPRGCKSSPAFLLAPANIGIPEAGGNHGDFDCVLRLVIAHSAKDDVGIFMSGALDNTASLL